MVYAVQAHLVFANKATRDTRLAQLQSANSGRGTWDQVEIVLSDDVTIEFTARYTSKNDQLAINNATKTAVGLQPGSVIQIHDCTHDEGDEGCTVDERVEI